MTAIKICDHQHSTELLMEKLISRDDKLSKDIHNIPYLLNPLSDAVIQTHYITGYNHTIFW